MDVETIQRRCPRLGGDVAFRYCKTCEAGRTPCFKVFDCWWERFDVVDHLKRCLSPAAFARLAQRRPAPDKVTSLVDLIRQAQERVSRD